MNVLGLFQRFKEDTDDVSAAILTLATILNGANDQLLSVKQAADALGVSRDSVYELVNSGRLKYRKIGRAIRINASDLDRAA